MCEVSVLFLELRGVGRGGGELELEGLEELGF
jgi:hypothetical protein